MRQRFDLTPQLNLAIEHHIYLVTVLGGSERLEPVDFPLNRRVFLLAGARIRKIFG